MKSHIIISLNITTFNIEKDTQQSDSQYTDRKRAPRIMKAEWTKWQHSARQFY